MFGVGVWRGAVGERAVRKSLGVAVRKSVGVAVVAVLVGGALAGCSGGSQDSSAGDQAAKATASAGKTAAPTAQANVNPDWLITAQGIGPYKLGDTYTPDNAALQVENFVCPIRATNDPEHGLFWQLSAQDTLGTANEIIVWLPETGTVPPAGPTTDQGIGLGSTRAEFDTAYPSAKPAYGPGGEPMSPEAAPAYVVDMDGVPVTFRFTADDASATVDAVTVGASLFYSQYCT